ncbi:Signal peptide peptidase-like 2B [Bagarius yarrelli]|uniref:Signal peptide peptidase-like 2B n=1 Tax=Bagarius yarrelli TaxID=175774 RepID=A0A556TZQ8_BAGYA|nr:Signal peptide peptidase-like 2B [Bagarius yarrelli]
MFKKLLTFFTLAAFPASSHCRTDVTRIPQRRALMTSPSPPPTSLRPPVMAQAAFLDNVITFQQFVMVLGEYGVAHFSNLGKKGKNYCIHFNSLWTPLPPHSHSTFAVEVYDLTPSVLCSDADVPDSGFTEYVVMAMRGNCTFSEKVHLAQKKGAKGLLIISKEFLIPPQGTESQYKEINIPLALISYADLLDIRTMKEEQSGESEEKETVTMTAVQIGLWVGMSCLVLMLLYIFYDYLGHIGRGLLSLHDEDTYTAQLQTQPALLYLVPCSVLFSLAVALWRSELKLYWNGVVSLPSPIPLAPVSQTPTPANQNVCEVTSQGEAPPPATEDEGPHRTENTAGEVH